MDSRQTNAIGIGIKRRIRTDALLMGFNEGEDNGRRIGGRWNGFDVVWCGTFPLFGGLL